MYWYGYVILGLMLLATLALAGAGIMIIRRRREWFFRAIGLVTALLGISTFLTLIIGIIAKYEPFVAILVQIAIAFSLCLFIFWLAMLIDCATHERDNNERLLWVLIIIFTNWIGALIYLLARRPLRIQESGS